MLILIFLHILLFFFFFQFQAKQFINICMEHDVYDFDTAYV